MRDIIRITTLTVPVTVLVVFCLISAVLAAKYGFPFVNRDQANCRGEAATHIVNADETVMGTEGDDVFVVLDAQAEIWTQQGDDLVCVYGPAADSSEAYHGSDIYLGPGNNTVITYGGSNTINASTGNDLIYLNGNYEEVDGHDGNDTVWALGATSAHVDGADGDDTIYGSPGGDNLSGGGGVDFIMGNGGNDTLNGEGSSDTLMGGLGQDTLNGGDGIGNDMCIDHDQNTTFNSCENISQPPFPPLPESS